MHGVEAARRLRKSSTLSVQPDFQIEERIIENKRHKIHDDVKSKNILDSKKLQNISIKICIVTFIIFLLVVYKSYFEKTSANNEIIKNIQQQYSKNYSWEQVCMFANSVKDIVVKDFQDISSKFNLGGTIPTNGQVDIYKDNNQPISEGISDIQENDVLDEKKDENKDEVKENTEAKEPEYEEAVSAVSVMDQDVQDILNQKITFISPAKGVITSRFGVREVTDPVVTPYHTGLDIANVKGTNIVSSIDGTVTKVEENEYYGKFVEVEKNGVITKYAHMSEQLVKKGQVVKAGELIGKMGMTGPATGNHVHLEIKINGRVVDPEIFVKI